MKKLISLIIFLLLTASAYCQPSAPEMADTMRDNGKIYVVVLVLSIVFVCLATYLIIIDRKLKKLEERK
jgi:hypothetical protein